MNTAFFEPTPMRTLPPAMTKVARTVPGHLPAASRATAVQPEIKVQATLAQAVLDMRAGRLHEAEKSLLQLLRLYPELGSVHANLGLVYRHLARLDDAVHELEEATRLAPEHAGYHNQLGLTCRMLGYFERARRAYERAIEIDASHAGALINLGILHDRYFDEPARAAALYVRGAAHLPREAGMVTRWLTDVMRRSGRNERGGLESGAGPIDH